MQTNDGLTLDRYLSEKGPLTPPQAAKVALQVAQQMAGAGGSFLIHPGRILAGRDGSVRLLPPPAEELALPTIVEFPAYASPEEIRGGTPDLRSGFYSLGCTLFELLAGTPPYVSRNPKETLRGHLEGPIPDVRDHASGVPDALAETLHELLAKDPELRIQTPAELIRRLKQALAPGGGAVAAAPPRPPAGQASMGGQADTARQAGRGGHRPAPRPGAAAGTMRPAGGGRAPGRLGAAGRKPNPGARGAASRRRVGVASGGPSRLGRAGRGGPGGGRAGVRDDFDEEEAVAAPEIRKRSYPCSILGGVIGLALGLLVIMNLSRKSEGREKAEKRLVQETVAEANSKIVRTRMSDFKAALEKRRTDARMRLENSRKLGSAGDRKESLLQALATYHDSAVGPELAQELVKVWPEALAGPQADVKEAEAGFARHREEANKLYGEGKIGDAIRRIREAESDFGKTHGKEIDELLLRWSDEIATKWERDKARAERLGRDGDPDGAVKVMREAMEYGDGQVRSDAEKTITKIQSQALMISRQNKKAVKENADGDGKAKDDDASELEEEFRDEAEITDDKEKGDGKEKEENQE